jgi:hypothetical protein
LTTEKIRVQFAGVDILKTEELPASEITCVMKQSGKKEEDYVSDKPTSEPSRAEGNPSVFSPSRPGVKP